MFHLNARVYFDEVELAGRCDQKLHRARVGVPDGAPDGHRGLAHASPQIVVERRRRAFLDDLLMPALHGTIAFEQVQQVAVGIAEDLKLHMPRALHVAFHQQRSVAKRPFSFAGGRFDGFRKLRWLGYDAHSAPAAASRRLNQHRELHVGVSGVVCRDHRNARRRGNVPSGCL